MEEHRDLPVRGRDDEVQPPRSGQVGHGHGGRFPAHGVGRAGAERPRHRALVEHLDRARPSRRHRDVELAIAVEVRERQAVGHERPECEPYRCREAPRSSGHLELDVHEVVPVHRGLIDDRHVDEAVAVQISRGHRDGRQPGRAANRVPEDDRRGRFLHPGDEDALRTGRRLVGAQHGEPPVTAQISHHGHGPRDEARPAGARFTSGGDERGEEPTDEKRNPPACSRDDGHGIPRCWKGTRGRARAFLRRRPGAGPRGRGPLI